MGLRSPFLHVAMIEVILRSIPKRGDRDASENHPNHSHVERGGSKTHPAGPPAASCQHTVLRLPGGHNSWLSDFN